MNGQNNLPNWKRTMTENLWPFQSSHAVILILTAQHHRNVTENESKQRWASFQHSDQQRKRVASVNPEKLDKLMCELWEENDE